jgi:hypothetical protein
MNPGRKHRKRSKNRRGRRSNPLWRILSSGKYSGRGQGRGRRRHKLSKYRRPKQGWHNPFRNPASIVSGLTAGFKPGILMEGAVILGGGLLNTFVSNTLIAKVPQIPEQLKSGPGKYLFGLATAGLAYLGTSRFLPKYANNMLLGGVVGVGMEAAMEYLPLKGLGDFLTQGQVNSARSMDGMNDFLVQSQVDSARQMGAYDPIAEDLAMAEGV